MSIATADIETDLFYAEGDRVYRRGVVEHNDQNQLTGAATQEADICICTGENAALDARQLARALNRLPKAEAILIDVVGQLRALPNAVQRVKGVSALAFAIEEWMVSE